jgi:glycosyltransferase involved in cell wall biosynthesis
LKPERRSTKAGTKVLYFVVEETDYPRNARVREYLAARGAEITVVPRPVRKSKWREYAAIGQLGLKHRSGYDLVILAEFSTNAFLVSWLVAKLNGATHAVDFFVGKYETIVEDRGKYTAKHPLAMLLRLFDRLALAGADVAFSDTQVRAAQFEELSGGRTKVRSLPVGAPAWSTSAVAELPAEAREALHVIYYGHYIDLHGADVLLEGIIAASANIPIRATFVGEGNIKAWMVNRVEEARLEDRIVFVGFEEPKVLMRRVARNDVVLGIFGTSAKASSVIANKVWQGLYSGKIVLTRSSAALDEISGIAGDRLLQVEPGSAAAIAAGLEHIHRDKVNRTDASAQPLSIALEDYVKEQFDRAFALPPLEKLFS